MARLAAAVSCRHAGHLSEQLNGLEGRGEKKKKRQQNKSPTTCRRAWFLTKAWHQRQIWKQTSAREVYEHPRHSTNIKLELSRSVKVEKRQESRREALEEEDGDLEVWCSSAEKSQPQYHPDTAAQCSQSQVPAKPTATERYVCAVMSFNWSVYHFQDSYAYLCQFLSLFLFKSIREISQPPRSSWEHVTSTRKYSFILTSGYLTTAFFEPDLKVLLPKHPHTLLNIHVQQLCSSTYCVS